MSQEARKILELFSWLDIEEKESLLKRLESMIVAERKAPEKTHLEDAWAEIERLIHSLSMYPYVDDQLEIDEIWEICEDLIKTGNLSKESWDVRKRIVSKMIAADYFDYYGCSDPMQDLCEALCITEKEKLEGADMMVKIGTSYMIKKSAGIYKKSGQLQKYFDCMEQILGDKCGPYLELIEYYKDKDEERSVKIAEEGLKKCRDDQTDFIIFLMNVARKNGDQEKYKKLCRGAKMRRCVNYEKVKESMVLPL